MMSSRTKKAVKAVRAFPAVNTPITTAIRAALRLRGRPSPWVTKHLPRSGTVRVTLPNGAELRLWSRADDWIPTQIFWGGLDAYEPETVYTFFRLAEQATTTINVGAYIGYYAVMASLANPAGRVIALEPYPPTFDRLRQNVSLNRLSNVECRNVAAGAKSGLGQLHYFDSGLPSAASLDVNHLAPWGPDRMDVALVRLDDLVNELQLAKVDLILIDAEGSEADVLAGARSVIRRDRPRIICEILPRSRPEMKVIHELRALGYRIYGLLENGPLECDELGHNSGDNFLFSVDRM